MTMTPVILVLCALSVLCADAAETTVTYSGREIAGNWYTFFDGWEPQDGVNLEYQVDWNDDGCSTASGMWVVSKMNYYGVSKVEIGLTPKRVKDSMFWGVYYGQEELLGDQEAYFLNDGETTDMVYHNYDNPEKTGIISFSLGRDNANCRIDYIKVTYYDTAGGNRGLAWSESSATAYLGEPFTAPTLSGETSEVTYSSSDPTVAAVTPEGEVLPASTGSCIVTAKCPESYPWASAEASYTLTVKFELTGQGTDETITLTEAGALQEKVTGLESVRIRSIKVSGPINGKDLAYLHMETGRFTTLQSIDLSEATLSPDDECYATRTERSDIGMGSTTWQYIMSDEDREESHTTPTGLGGGVTTVKVYNTGLIGAFCGMPNLKRALLPAEVKELGEYTYSGCTSLIDATVPENATYIGEYSFYGCEALTYADIPASVKEIGEHAFANKYGKNGLLTANLSNVEKMGPYAFYRTNLTGSIDISSLTSVPDYAFTGCNNLEKALLSSRLDSIGESSFGGTSLKELVLPETCTYIGSSAFSGSDLKNVSIPEGLFMIGTEAFRGTPWLEDLESAATDIVYIGKAAYSLKSGYRPADASIREGTLGICPFLFNGATDLNSISLPSSLRHIGYNAFNNCKNLTQLNLPESLETIGKEAFRFCDKITELKFGGNIKDIGEHAFAECRGIGELELGNSIETIGYGAFQWCDGLVRVKYNVADARGENIFDRCNGLESIEFGADVQNIPAWFASNCPNLAKVDFEGMPQTTFPKTAAASKADKSLDICDYAFSYCRNLSSVVIPEYTKSIGESAFSQCNLKNVTCYLTYPIDIENTGLNENKKNTSIYIHQDVIDIFNQEINWNRCNLQPIIFESDIEDVFPEKRGESIKHFNLNGLYDSNPTQGIYIRKKGSEAVKVLM